MNLKGTLKPFVAVFIISVASLYSLYIYYLDQERYFIKWTWTQTISCHYATEGDALPSAEELSPPEDSIFFHETSCRGGLNSREACSVESAARKHPNRSIYVYFNSPVSEVVLRRSCLAKLMQFKNVIIARLHTAEYAQGTALGEMLTHKDNNQSSWRIELTSDMLRYISMFKYGGVYLDTDVLVVKPLDSLGTNWVAREDGNVVNVAVLAISKEGLGHELITQILDGIRSDYRPDQWLHHGPGAMTRTLLKLCNTTQVNDLNSDICHGFKVYETSLIYPVHWADANTYFEIGKLPDTKAAFTHHLWNKITRDMPLAVGSPYDRLSWQHCPTIREMYGDRFGS